MKILVTGSIGFIGSHLVPKLKKEGFDVLETPSRSSGFDIRDESRVLDLPPADVVVHLAAIINAPLSWESPSEVLDTNINGTLNVLRWCEKNKANVIFAGSYAYGTPRYLPIDERHPLSAENPYAVSKLAAEFLCQVYQKKYGFDTTVLRLFNPYGPGQSEGLVIGQMIAQLKKRGKIEINSGKPKRDFVFVGDVADAFVAAVKKIPKGFSVYNIGSGKSWSIREVAEKLVELSGKKAEIIDRGLERPNEIMDTLANIEKAKKQLGWEPKIDIDEGLRITYES